MKPLTDLSLLNPTALWALASLPLLAIILLTGILTANRARGRFLNLGSTRPWAPSRSAWLASCAAIFALISVASICLALARPASDPKPQEVSLPGHDLVFVLDVSRSMLVGDLRPSRLERAKLAIRDVLESAKGERAGLVAFAGVASPRCPLTTDYSFFRLALDECSPESIPVGGSNLGEALRTATIMLFPKDAPSEESANVSKTIVLLTDGEDQQSRPIEAAQVAGKKHIRIITIGLGSELTGSPVPAAQQSSRPGSDPRYAQVGADPYLSKMNPKTLEDIAAASPGGKFLNVGTGNIDMDQVYTRLIRTTEPGKAQTDQIIRYTEWFQPFLGLALLLMLTRGVVYART